MIVSDPGTIIRQVPQGPRSCQRSVSQCHLAAVSGKSFFQDGHPHARQRDSGRISCGSLMHVPVKTEKRLPVQFKGLQFYIVHTNLVERIFDLILNIVQGD